MASVLPVFGLRGYFCILYACGILNISLSLSRLLKTARVRLSLSRWILRPLGASLLCVGIWRWLPAPPVSTPIGLALAAGAAGGLYGILLSLPILLKK